MLTLTINNQPAGRFASKKHVALTDSLLVTEDTDNSVIVAYNGDNDWEVAYSKFIEKRQKEYNEAFSDYARNNTVNSINNINGHIYIVGGRGIAMNIVDNSIFFSNTMYNTSNSKEIARRVDTKANLVIADYIYRYQMCLYHWYNTILAKSITNNDNTGTYLKYMAARALWNNYVYTSCINRKVLSSGDSIFITLGFNNTKNVEENVEIYVDITPTTTHNNLIWYGIFLEEVGPRTTNISEDEDKAESLFSYKITRDGTLKKLVDSYFAEDTDENNPGTDASAELDSTEMNGRVWVPDPSPYGEESDDPNNPVDPSAFIDVATPVDITNPNNCLWSTYGGTWSHGTIEQTCTLKSGESCKYVYSISKHPSVNGYTKRSAVPVYFDIRISYTWSAGTSVKEYKNILCYMQERAEDPQDTVNGGNEKRYILVANDSMGKYTKPTT